MVLAAVIEILAEFEKRLIHRMDHMTKQIQQLTDAVTANTTATNSAVAALATGGVNDPTDAPAIVAAVSGIQANTAALVKALAGTPTTSSILGTVSSFTGVAPGPFVLTVGSASVGNFSLGSTLQSKAGATATTVDAGTALVSAVDPVAGTVTVTSTDGWIPATGDVLGLTGTLVPVTPPVVTLPVAASFLNR